MNNFTVPLLQNAVLAALLLGLTSPSAAAAKPSEPPTATPCQRLSERLPSLSRAACQGAGLMPTGASSLRGFPILSRRIPALVRAKDARKEPVRVLLLGGIHGDELTSSVIVFKWMQWMKDPQAQEFEWNIVPALNPDGLLAPRPSRLNANGVDLNRNFPTPGWHKDAPAYWARATKRDPRRFPGKNPLSEPESRWVNDEMERFQPQVIISVHAPFGVLDLDGPARPPSHFGRLMFNRVGVYPGSLGNYGGNHKNVPVLTIELPNALAMPSEAESRRIWLDMLAWIKLHVPPSDTGLKRSPALAAR